MRFGARRKAGRLYQEKCGANNAEYVTRLEGLCAALLGPAGQPVRVARAIRVASEGLWMDLVTQAEPYSVDEALETLLDVAAAFFPQAITRA